jgi:hypothetical protein
MSQNARFKLLEIGYEKLTRLLLDLKIKDIAHVSKPKALATYGIAVHAHSNITVALGHAYVWITVQSVLLFLFLALLLL